MLRLQANYSLDVRDVEREIVPMLQDQKVGMMVWSPLSGGLLTGKYKRNGQKEEGRLNNFPFPPFHEERAYDVLDVLTPMAEQKTSFGFAIGVGLVVTSASSK